MKNTLRILATAIVLMMNLGTVGAIWTPEVDSLIAQANKINDYDAAKCFNDICWKIRNSDPEIAIQYGMNAIEAAQRSSNYEQLIKGYSYIGVCHRNLGNYAEALEYYSIGLQKALQYQVRDQEAYAYINLANIYLYHDNFGESESNLNKAMVIANELKDSSILSYCHLNLGRTYMGLNELEKAEDNFKTSYEIRVKNSSLNYQSLVSKKYLADCHAKMGEVELARQEYQECFDDPNIIGDYDFLSDISHKLSRLLYDEQKYDSALVLAKKSLEYSKVVGSKISIRSAYNTIGDIYYAQNKYKEAAENFSNQIVYNDSIFNSALSQKIFNIQFSSEQYKKQSEIKMLLAEKKASRNLIYGLVFVLLMGILLIILSLRSSRKMRQLNKTLQKQQKQIADSIFYAHRIQNALLPNNDEFGMVFRDRFIYYTPRNVVSGDFYWAHSDANFEVIVVADCTGHGVPGAFMSILGICALHEIVGDSSERSAGNILNKLREMVKKLLRQSTSDDSQKDGMDIAIMVVDRKTKILQYSGGNIPLIYIRNDKMYQLKPLRNPIGVYIKETPFETQTLTLQQGDLIYLSSDGYSSQFGGDKGSKIKMSGYKEIILKNHKLPMDEQKQLLEEAFIEWKGNRTQIDDILVAGFQV